MLFQNPACNALLFLQVVLLNIIVIILQYSSTSYSPWIFCWLVEQECTKYMLSNFHTDPTFSRRVERNQLILYSRPVVSHRSLKILLLLKSSRSRQSKHSLKLCECRQARTLRSETTSRLCEAHMRPANMWQGWKSRHVLNHAGRVDNANQHKHIFLLGLLSFFVISDATCVESITGDGN